MAQKFFIIGGDIKFSLASIDPNTLDLNDTILVQDTTPECLGDMYELNEKYEVNYKEAVAFFQLLSKDEAKQFCEVIADTATACFKWDDYWNGIVYCESDDLQTFLSNGPASGKTTIVKKY